MATETKGKSKGPRYSNEELTKILSLVSSGKSQDQAIESVLAERVKNEGVDREALTTFVQELATTANTEDGKELAAIQDAYNKLAKQVKALWENQTAHVEWMQEQVKEKFGEKAVALVTFHVSYQTDDTMLPANIVTQRTTVDVRERAPITHPEGYVRPMGVALNASFDLATLTEKQKKLHAALIEIGPSEKDGLYHNAQYRAAYEKAFGEKRETNFNLVGELPCMVAVYPEKPKTEQPSS